MEAKELALAIADAALEKQAEALEIIDVTNKVDYACYLVICSGRSDRHVDAIATASEIAMKKLGIHPLGVEGREANQWVLIDFNDVILHIFEDQKRGYYDLDSLWIDAKRIPVRKVSGS